MNIKEQEKKEVEVPYPDVFWAYRFLAVKDWL